MLLGFALTTAATIRAVSALHLSKPTGIRQSYTELRGHYLRIVSVFLSVTIRMVGGSILLYFATIFVGVMAASVASLLGTIGLVIGVVLAIAAFVGGILLGLTLFVRYSMAVQACVIEDISAKQALKRSAFLAKGSRNRILTVYFLWWAVSSAVLGGTMFLASLATGLLRSAQLGSGLVTLASFIALLFTIPWLTVAMSLAYYDERVRKEGFDLQVLLAALESSPAQAATAP
jgi:hypothetical protein